MRGHFLVKNQEVTLINKTTFCCLKELDNLEILYAWDMVAPSSRHTHETLTLSIVGQGTALLNHKGTAHSISPECLVVINPDDAHACHTENALGYSQCVVYPSLALIEKITYELTLHRHILPLFPQAIITDKTLLSQVKNLSQILPSSSSTLEKETLLLETLTTLIRNHAKIPPLQNQPVYPEPKVVNQIREYLEANYKHNTSLNELAALTHFSPFYLSRIFYQAVGLPPHLYLTQVRILRAKKLLAMGWCIAQVAQEVGFAHQSHLHRHFKKMVGVTPKQYQKSKNVQDYA